MIDHANIVITAWDGDKLVGIARALSDFAYCCYLSDLAVDKEYQNQGIGHELVNEVQKLIGEESNLVLLSAPEAIEYYPKIGFEKSRKFIYYLPQKIEYHIYLPSAKFTI